MKRHHIDQSCHADGELERLWVKWILPFRFYLSLLAFLLLQNFHPLVLLVLLVLPVIVAGVHFAVDLLVLFS